MMKVLVVGGAGYIGSHVCKLLHKKGYKVYVYDNLERGHRSAVKWGPLLEGDLRDSESINSAMTSETFDAVMHFAAYAYVGESVEYPDKYFQNNVCGTLNLLHAMKQAGVKKLIFSSTCAVYGSPKSMPVSEETPIAPDSPYGMSKYMAEQAILSYGMLGYINPVVFRYFNVIGSDPDVEIGEDHDPETHILPLAVNAALGRQSEFSIFGDDYPTPDGTCIRDYLHVNDLALAHIKALHYDSSLGNHIFNLGTGTPLSVKQILDKVEQVTGGKLHRTILPRRLGDAVALHASAKKANHLLDWFPEYIDVAFAIENVVSYIESGNSKK